MDSVFFAFFAGEEPTLRGFYHGCGFNSAGMMFGGGCGLQLAKWVVEGTPDLDMYSWDISRFNRKLTGNNSWIRQRSHEAYAKNYSIVYPYDEPLASRKMNQSPLGPVLEKAGCVYQERHGFERPGWFSSAGPAPVQRYDWYGAYDNQPNPDQTYINRLKQDYTFEFPEHHSNVRSRVISIDLLLEIHNYSNRYQINRWIHCCLVLIRSKQNVKQPVSE